MEVLLFRKLVLKHFRFQGRDLPWRNTKDPYRIMVSEIMLQQTQVERVIAYYEEWLKKFPTVRVLAKASLGDVLRTWQGLGYNRRGKMLHMASKEIVEKYKGIVPKSVEELESLPGIGPYTARAIATFAFDARTVFIETNIRTVITHHFFPRKKKVDDKELIKILEKALPRRNMREWYYALMDYGSYLKRNGVRINNRAKGYTKQSIFEGSGRQARGAILKALVFGPRDTEFLLKLLGPSRKEQVQKQLASLVKEGMIELSSGMFSLPR